MSRLFQAKLVSLLCVASLIATAYILTLVPNTRPKSPNQAKSGPVRQYIISYLNGALSLLCALNSITLRDKPGVHDGFWLLCLLPVGRWLLSYDMPVQPKKCAVSFVVITLARRLMLSVDVDELEKLKYGYKGA